jgi:hypothetical protein
VIPAVIGDALPDFAEQFFYTERFDLWVDPGMIQAHANVWLARFFDPPGRFDCSRGNRD